MQKPVTRGNGNTHKPILLSLGILTGFDESLLNLCTAELHIIVFQRLIKSPKETYTHCKKEEKHANNLT